MPVDESGVKGFDHMVSFIGKSEAGVRIGLTTSQLTTAMIRMPNEAREIINGRILLRRDYIERVEEMTLEERRELPWWPAPRMSRREREAEKERERIEKQFDWVPTDSMIHHSLMKHVFAYDHCGLMLDELISTPYYTGRQTLGEGHYEQSHPLWDIRTQWQEYKLGEPDAFLTPKTYSRLLISRLHDYHNFPAALVVIDFLIRDKPHWTIDYTKALFRSRKIFEEHVGFRKIEQMTSESKAKIKSEDATERMFAASWQDYVNENRTSYIFSIAFGLEELNQFGKEQMQKIFTLVLESEFPNLHELIKDEEK